RNDRGDRVAEQPANFARGPSTQQLGRERVMRGYLGRRATLPRALVIEPAGGKTLFERLFLLRTPATHALFLIDAALLVRSLFLDPALLEPLLERFLLNRELCVHAGLLLIAPLREPAPLLDEHLLGANEQPLLRVALALLQLALGGHRALREQLIHAPLFVRAPRGELLF